MQSTQSDLINKFVCIFMLDSRLLSKKLIIFKLYCSSEPNCLSSCIFIISYHLLNLWKHECSWYWWLFYWFVYNIYLFIYYCCLRAYMLYFWKFVLMFLWNLLFPVIAALASGSKNQKDLIASVLTEKKLLKLHQ